MGIIRGSGATASPAVTIKTEPAYLTPVKEDIETLKQDISHVQDGMVTQSKMQKELLKVFKSLQQKLTQPVPAPVPMQPIYQPQQTILDMQYQQPHVGHQPPYMGPQQPYTPRTEIPKSGKAEFWAVPLLSSDRAFH